MKNETSINIKTFLKENIAVNLICPIILVIGFLLGNLYHINLEFIIYMGLFIIIVDTSSMAIQYQYYKKAHKKILTNEAPFVSIDQENEKKWQHTKDMEDFFALWIHQIKTPIAALNLLLQADEQNVALCRNEVFKIENYVEMALGYIRFEEMNNDIELKKYPLETLIRQIVKKYATIFIHKHLSIKLENLNYHILTDEKWFGFVLEQILSNALKYTNVGTITITGVPDNESHQLKIIIQDTGIGIRSEDLPRLFEKGFTGYNGRMDKKASGLGLYLCKGVCEQLGHGIRIESQENIGTKVIITVYAENVAKHDLLKN